jgi:hypothetical protein
VTDEKYLFFDQLPAFLEEQTGLRLSKPTLWKICSPGVGTGPKPAAYWGRRPVFLPSTVLDWARAQLSARPTHIHPVPKRKAPPGGRGEKGLTRHARDRASRESAQ